MNNEYYTTNNFVSLASFLQLNNKDLCLEINKSWLNLVFILIEILWKQIKKIIYERL